MKLPNLSKGTIRCVLAKAEPTKTGEPGILNSSIHQFDKLDRFDSSRSGACGIWSRCCTPFGCYCCVKSPWLGWIPVPQ